MIASASDNLVFEVIVHLHRIMFWACVSGLETLCFPCAATLALCHGNPSYVVGSLALRLSTRVRTIIGGTSLVTMARNIASLSLGSGWAAIVCRPVEAVVT
jgi:hypothetical protein